MVRIILLLFVLSPELNAQYDSLNHQDLTWSYKKNSQLQKISRPESTIIFSKDDDSEIGGHPDIKFPKGIAFLLVIPGAAIGTLFGALTPNTDDYNFKNLPDLKKKRVIDKGV